MGLAAASERASSWPGRLLPCDLRVIKPPLARRSSSNNRRSNGEALRAPRFSLGRDGENVAPRVGPSLTQHVFTKRLL